MSTLARILLALSFLVPATTSAAPHPPRPKFPKLLIYAGWFGNTTPTPSFIASNKTFLETQPFHGLVVYLRNDSTGQNVTQGITTTTDWPTTTIASCLAPIANQSWSTLTNNFGLVQFTTPPDFFDDWTVVINNFSHLAQALKDAGLKGFVLDNEQYFSSWGNYPEGVAYAAQHSLADYQAQARLRGNQVMAAMTSIFPTIAVITLHGPYISEPSAPSSMLFPQWQTSNELLGPFFVGFRETIGEVSENVDGGELYGLRSTSEFLNSYNWRKYTISTPATNCAFMPASNPDDRTTWSSHTSISFGVYDKTDPTTGRTMDSTIVTPTLTNALSQTDHYVWFYTENGSFLLPPGTTGAASQTWVDAVRAAITPPPASPTSVIYGGWFDVGANAVPTPSFLSANATWIDANLPFDGFVVHLSSYPTNYSATIMEGGASPIGYTNISTMLSPLMNGSQSKFTRLKDNFVLVQTLNAPDWYDDTGWATTQTNFTDLAHACVTAQLKGIFFDNENYGGNWGKASPGHTAAETQIKARARGKSVMQAMVAQFPGIAVISAHGPYLSEPGSQGAFTGSPWLASLYPVTGAFFVGFREGLGGSTLNVDGGELYTLISAADFQSAYTWRKTTFATSSYNSGAGCAFLPASNPDDRTNWSSVTSIGFGLYDGQFNDSGVNLSDGSTTAQTVLSNALHQADRYTWFYAENRTFFLAPGSNPKAANQTWVNMMNAGRVH